MRAVAGPNIVRWCWRSSPGWLLVVATLAAADEGPAGGVAGVPYQCNATGSSPPNDCCEDPQVVDLQALEMLVVPFDTTEALTDGPEDKLNPCGSGANDAQLWKDVWYRVNVSEDGFLTASVCSGPTNFDTKIAAYQVPGGVLDCDGVLENIIACNDDCEAAAPFRSEVTFAVFAGESYLVRLGGFSPSSTELEAASGPGEISFFLQSFCSLEPQAGDFTEQETCGDLVNDFCFGGAAFETIACDQTVFGSAWGDGGLFDADVYVITVEDNGTQVEVGLESEFTGIVALVVLLGDIAECNGELIDIGSSGECQGDTISTVLNAGDYIIAVGTGNPTEGFVGEGFPCGTFNDYRLEVSCVLPEPMGACQLEDGSCLENLTLEACDALGGEWVGDDSTCTCPGVGPCDQANGSPGCADQDCCNTVCALDQFCCNVQWDEFCAATALENCAFPCDGDVNGDEEVGVEDLDAVILDWGCQAPPGPCPGDIDQDGIVGILDLLGVILDWGPCS